MKAQCPHCGKDFRVRSTMKRRKPVHKWRGGHEYLVTFSDKLQRRMEVYEAAGGEVIRVDDEIDDLQPAMCQGCAETHPVGWLEGHWHHNCELKKKCDSVKCALWICPTGHKLLHGRFIGGKPK